MFSKLKSRQLIAMIAVLVAAIIGFRQWTTYLTDSPIKEPTVLTSQVTLTKEFNAPVSGKYDLELEFDRAGHSFDELQSLIGSDQSKGVEFPLRVTLRNERTRESTLDKVLQTSGSFGWSAQSVTRFVTNLQLSKDHYTITIENLEPVPRLVGLKTAVSLNLDVKNSDGWAIPIYWYGSIITVLIFPLVIVAICLTLLIRVGRSQRARHVG